MFARLVAEAAIEGLPPVTLLAMLKHERCGLDRHAVMVLERAVLVVPLVALVLSPGDPPLPPEFGEIGSWLGLLMTMAAAA